MQCNPTGLKFPRTLLGLLLLLPLTVFAEPKVVASIKPVHSLVAGVMRGVGEPLLLVRGGASPHEYNLRPSDARAINEADIVFWIGPDLESFLVKPLNNAKDKARSIALLRAPGITVLPLRQGGAWEPHRRGHHRDAERAPRHEHDEERHEHDHDHPEASFDAHVWLDPINAITMVRQIVAVLGTVDPDHRVDYERNGTALVERLNRLHQHLVAELTPLKEQPYIVFHDAYQYFERRYGLSAVGSVVLDPEQRSGAKRVAEIRARIRSLGVRCVFVEPQFQPALAETAIAGSSARRGILDPLGAELPAGPEVYFQLLQGLADGLRTCLSGT